MLFLSSVNLFLNTSVLIIAAIMPIQDEYRVDFFLWDLSLSLSHTLICMSQVWGKPPTTSQLMSKIEKRKELLSLELDFDDFMMPFNLNVQRKRLDLEKPTG